MNWKKTLKTYENCEESENQLVQRKMVTDESVLMLGDSVENLYSCQDC